MNTFEQAGEGMLLAHEGQQQIARALAEELKAAFVRLFKASPRATSGFDQASSRWNPLQQQ